MQLHLACMANIDLIRFTINQALLLMLAVTIPGLLERWIICYPVDSLVRIVNTYPLVKDLSSGYV